MSETWGVTPWDAALADIVALHAMQRATMRRTLPARVTAYAIAHGHPQFGMAVDVVRGRYAQSAAWDPPVTDRREAESRGLAVTRPKCRKYPESLYMRDVS